MASLVHESEMGGMDRVVPNSIEDLFEQWFLVGLQGVKKKLWCSLFFMVVWSLCGYRNRIIFDRKSVNLDEFLQRPMLCYFQLKLGVI